MQASMISSYSRLAKAIAAQFGPNCEVVVHDLENNALESSIVAIENGHVTGRKLGDGPSQVVLDALNGDRAHMEDHLAFLSQTSDGRILKSSTIFIKDEDGIAIGIFSINYDITLLLSLQTELQNFTVTEKSRNSPPRVSNNVNELLDELIQQSVELVGKPVSMMTRDDKVRAIRYLNRSGAFLITRSGDRVCKHFGISKFTLYGYLDEAKSSGE